MDIDVSKENIQPLRGGRNLVQLGTALQAQSDVDAQKQLQLQKQEHEAAVRNYQGPDPLDPWFNYIQWVEQSFPKHGHEGHIDKLIKECLQLFENDKRYYQDRRFVKLWIKYVDCLSNPLEIYQRLYNTGIGVECAEFYRAWACYCEESSDYKKANQVYMLGLQAKAQPLDELEQAHMNFQLFFAQRMLHDDSPTKRKAASALAETRMALTSLKSFKRRNIANAPIQRVGETVRSNFPGVIRQQIGNTDNRLPNSNVMVNIYEDAPSTSQVTVPVADAPGPSSIVQACSNIENQKEVGIWTNPKTKMVHTNVVPHQILPFTPYEDEDDRLRLPPKHLPYCVDDLAFTVPLCVPDPPDQTKISCYNKSQVYINDTEYSLEEIRSKKYNIENNVNSVITESVQVQHNYSNINETLAQCSALETLANCALDPEQDHLGQLMPLTIPTLQNITRVTNMHSPGEPKVLVNLDSKEVSELVTKKNDENQRSSITDKENHMNQYPTHPSNYGNENNGTTYGKNNLFEEFNRSLLGNFLGDSVTLNTKEARWELRNIFNDNETLVQPVEQQFDVPNFDIHEDKTITMNLNTKKKTENAGVKNLPQDKENENKFTVPVPVVQQNVNKTTFYEEPTCTQVFNFNINNASTPNMSQFKKPSHSIDQSTKFPSVPKFAIDESILEHGDQVICKRDETSPQHTTDQHATDNQGGGLSVIMEATREYNSKSGSNSSGQSIRTNFTGYTANFDSMYNNNDPQQPTSSKRNSISNQQRLVNGQFARTIAKRDIPENKGAAVPTPSSSVPYLSHDHQYQKPMPPNYNGYTPQTQRPMHNQYQQNYSYQQGYGNSQVINQQQQHGYTNPSVNSYNSPQHTGMQSSHSPVPPAFQSPPYSNQVGYHSPGHAMMSPQQGYAANRQEFQYPNQNERQHLYTNQQQQQAAVFQSPPQQAQYQNAQYYQRANQAAVNQSYNQQNYNLHISYNNANMYPTHNSNQSYNGMQNSYRQPQKHNIVENTAGYGVSNQSFQIYQSPHTSQGQNHNASVQRPHIAQELPETYTKQESHANLTFKTLESPVPEQTVPTKIPAPVKNPQHKSPTAALRNIRHDQPNIRHGQNSPDIGFSDQYLHFISNRNEPKDNANTPKFTNSPSISQKMHKNLYVSSPEQAQIPPSSGMSDSDSKDGMTAQTVTPIQTAKVAHVIEKQKDISKRQLDFDNRVEFQSEDSRDSVSKDSRISSVYSRHSDMHSDGYGMDVDSENSMECSAFKSTHSISLVETCDLPRPADIDFPKVIDPFNKKLLDSLLEYVKFPNKTHADGYIEVRSVPKLQVATIISVGNNKFSIEKQLGKGNYGAVFLCLDLHSNKSVAVKYQKPSRPWEFYICQEIKARIKDPFMLPGYMDITTGFLGDNASLFISEYSKYGSLLDVANKIRAATSKCINEFIVILLTSEMLSIIHYLHKAQIIHADIKPDNFLLMKIPTQEWRTPSLQLIDLGCAIDMSLFPEGTTFRELITTEGFTCTEMREGKPWTFQTDLYCLAGTIHVILMGSYMKVVNRLGQWNIDKKLPRYMKVSLWDKIFTTLLNVPDCNNLPDLMELKNEVDSVLNKIDVLSSQLRNFANVLKSR